MDVFFSFFFDYFILGPHPVSSNNFGCLFVCLFIQCAVTGNLEHGLIIRVSGEGFGGYHFDII